MVSKYELCNDTLTLLYVQSLFQVLFNIRIIIMFALSEIKVLSNILRYGKLKSHV